MSITNINNSGLNSYIEAETYAAMGNTINDNTGIPSPLPPSASSRIISISFDGNGGDELLTPPISPSPVTGGNYMGYKKVPLSIIVEGGFLSDSGDGGLIVGAGGDGLYNTPNAWLDMSSGSNSNNVGYIFGIERAGQIFFSARVCGGRMAVANDRTNVSGGGFADLIEGDKLHLWGCAERNSELWIYDANIGLVLRKKL